jgi:methionyl-tRNA formyltransferase
MRILVAGQKEFGAEVFRVARKAGHEIVAVACPQKNGKGDGPDRLAAAAKTFSVPIIHGGLNADNMPGDVDVIVAAHSHDFIGKLTRQKTRFGAFGYHPSLLPRHRGRDAVAWTIKMGDPVAGGSVYWLSGTMDGGPIAIQDWCWVRPGETTASLWREKLHPMGVRLMGVVLADVEKYFAERFTQDERMATFEPSLNPPRVMRPDLLRIGYKFSSNGAATPETRGT